MRNAFLTTLFINVCFDTKITQEIVYFCYTESYQSHQKQSQSQKQRQSQGQDQDQDQNHGQNQSQRQQNQQCDRMLV